MIPASSIFLTLTWTVLGETRIFEAKSVKEIFAFEDKCFKMSKSILSISYFISFILTQKIEFTKILIKNNEFHLNKAID